MKNHTHYFLALGLINLYSLLFIREMVQTWFCFSISFILAGISIVPNLLDNYAGANFQYEGVQLVKHRFSRRYRHPLFHSPWTIGYFLPFVYIEGKISNPYLSIIFLCLEIGWASHIFLDSLNPEGIPIGRKPIFSNHLSKHYQWSSHRLKEVHSFRLARIPFDSLKANKTASRIGLFLLAWNLAYLILNQSHIIIEVLR
ncbi:MAG: hypothetical protein ACFFAU_00315 [Candidatus Hodarchaeota archaeon]